MVGGRAEAVNPDHTGTKAAAHYQVEVAPGEAAVVRLRLTPAAPDALAESYPLGDPFGSHFHEVFAARRQEADDFFAVITPESLDDGRHAW